MTSVEERRRELYAELNELCDRMHYRGMFLWWRRKWLKDEEARFEELTTEINELSRAEQGDTTATRVHHEGQRETR